MTFRDFFRFRGRLLVSILNLSKFNNEVIKNFRKNKIYLRKEMLLRGVV